MSKQTSWGLPWETKYVAVVLSWVLNSWLSREKNISNSEAACDRQNNTAKQDGPCIIVCSLWVMSDSLSSFGLEPTRLFCPWDFSAKNTGVGCYFLLQGIFPTQRLKHVSCVCCTGRHILYQLLHLVQTLANYNLVKHSVLDAMFSPYYNKSYRAVPKIFFGLGWELMG